MGNTELLKNIVPLEEKNKGKNEYLYSLCFSKPINGLFVRRDIILSQQGHEIQWTFVLKWELILPGVIWESRECFQWNMSIRDIVTKWSYTHTDKFMFAWPLIAFIILCLLNTNTQQTLKKPEHKFWWGLMNQIQWTFCLFHFLNNQSSEKKSSHKSTCQNVQFSSVALLDTWGVVSWDKYMSIL